MTLRGLYLEPELSPAPFFPHDCKTLPTFGTMTQGCALEGEWCCVSGCALSGCFSMNNWAEECKWSLRMAARGRNPTLVTIWNAWCASRCGYGVLHFMHSKSKSYIYPFSPVLSCLFPPSSFMSLCSTPSLFEKKKSLEARGTSNLTCMKKKLYIIGWQSIGEICQDLIRTMVLSL